MADVQISVEGLGYIYRGEWEGKLYLPARDDGACDIHIDHGGAQPYRLVVHHVFPLELQAKVWPTVDPNRPSTAKVKVFANLCDNGHYATHGILDQLVKGNIINYKLLAKYRKEYHLAIRAVDMYVAAGAGASPEEVAAIR